MHTLRTMFIAALAATLLPTGLAGAQDAAVAVPQTTTAADAPLSLALASPPVSLLPLPAGPDDLLFAGETQKRTVLFVAQAEQTAGPTDLVLNIQSSISSAPEASRINVVLNDQDLGTFNLKSGAPYELRVPLPPGLVQPGFNAVSFTVDQAHRVDCSIEATYELWARIDPTTSGIEHSSSALGMPDFLSVLAAVRADAGDTSIHVVQPGALSGAQRDLLLDAVQALSIAAAIDRPTVDFGPGVGHGAGIDLVVGTRRDVTDFFGTTGLNPEVQPGINIARRPDGRIVLAIAGETLTDLKAQIGALAAYASRASVGTAAGLAALQHMRGTLLQARQKVSFATLGVDSRSFAGHLFRQSVSFRMPIDFYPADYARAGIHLDALFARGLAPGAELQFKINGSVVSTLVLSGSRSGQINDQVLPVALTAFRPGLNELTIEGRLPLEEDATCAPGTSSDNAGRLRIAATSYLELPELARSGRFPDLGAIEQSITGRDSDAVLQVVSDESPTSLDAAATFLARLAYSSGRSIATHVTSQAGMDGAEPVLVVAPFKRLPADMAARFPLDIASMPPSPAAGAADDASGKTLPSGSWSAGAQDWVGQLPTIAASNAGDVVYSVRSALYGLGRSIGFDIDLLRPDEALPRFVPAAATALLVAQFVDSSGNAPVTMITAPTDDALQPGVERLVESGWTALTGSAVTIAKDGTVLQALAPTGIQLYGDGAVTLANGRLMMAGWLSNNPAIYVALLAVFAILLGLSTGLVLWRSRTRAK